MTPNWDHLEVASHLPGETRWPSPAGAGWETGGSLKLKTGMPAGKPAARSKAHPPEGYSIENRRFCLIEVWQVQAVLRGRLLSSIAFAAFHCRGLHAPANETLGAAAPRALCQSAAGLGGALAPRVAGDLAERVSSAPGKGRVAKLHIRLSRRRRNRPRPFGTDRQEDRIATRGPLERLSPGQASRTGYEIPGRSEGMRRPSGTVRRTARIGARRSSWLSGPRRPGWHDGHPVT